MKKNILSVFILISGILISGGIISLADAETTNPSDIQYPISELGNCTDKASCKTYCDKPEKIDACLSFAEKNNLMQKEEIDAAKNFKNAGLTGPGGCQGAEKCEQYCGSSVHLEECTAFAEKNGMMSDQQLQDSEKVIAAIKNGLKPPACGGPKKCETYCSNPLHMKECMTFSIAAGIVPDNQKEQMQKTLDALKKGAKPPACQPNPPPDQPEQPGQNNQSDNGLPMCDEYCGTHTEECMSFSLATGMVPDDQKEQMQKTLTAFKQGIKPPACKPNPPDQSGQPGKPGQPNQSGQKNQNKSNQSGQGLQACDEYCADSSHVEECVKFSVAMGNMTQEQGQNSIKNGNKGPGGCIGKDACDTFCNNPDNQDTCFNFAKDNGMIPEGDLQKMQEGQQKMKDAFSSIPQEVLDCITSSSGADVVEKMKTGSVIGRKFGDSINQCFQKSGVEERPPGQDQSGQNQNDQGQSNQQIMPWADMCKNNTALACADEAGKFIVSAKVGSDGNPVCPLGSTAKCGNYQQNNQQGQQGQQNQQKQNQQGDTNQPGQNQLNQPGQLIREKIEPNQPKPGTVNSGGQQMPQQAGPGGCKGPEECKAYCESHQEECKNFQPQQNQQGQNQPGQSGENQPINQMQIQQQQFQPQPMEQQNLPPSSSPTSFLQRVQNLLANALNTLR